MKKFLLLITFSLILSFSFQLKAQNNERAFYFEQAKEQMRNENYEAANTTFRKLLQLGTQLPAEMPYLFAETLYQIGQYTNSNSFLQKYFEIMGKAGTYYDQAVALEKLLDKKLNKTVNCERCDISGYVTKTCPRCEGSREIITDCNYCQSVGKVGCEVCNGEGVIIKKNKLGANTYKTCHKCEGKGIHICSICNGKKQYQRFCPLCLGSGTIATDELCTH